MLAFIYKANAQSPRDAHGWAFWLSMDNPMVAYQKPHVGHSHVMCFGTLMPVTETHENLLFLFRDLCKFQFRFGKI